MSDVTVDRLIEVYLQLRSEKEAIDAAAKEQAAETVATMKEIEGILMKMANDSGVDSFKTAKGTAYVSTVDHAKVEDKGTFLEFVRGQELFDLLDVRAAKVAVRDHIEETGEPVPGINYGHTRKINVRQSK